MESESISAYKQTGTSASLSKIVYRASMFTALASGLAFCSAMLLGASSDVGFGLIGVGCAALLPMFLSAKCYKDQKSNEEKIKLDPSLDEPKTVRNAGFVFRASVFMAGSSLIAAPCALLADAPEGVYSGILIFGFIAAALMVASNELRSSIRNKVKRRADNPLNEAEEGRCCFSLIQKCKNNKDPEESCILQKFQEEEKIVSSMDRERSSGSYGTISML